MYQHWVSADDRNNNPSLLIEVIIIIKKSIYPHILVDRSGTMCMQKYEIYFKYMLLLNMPLKKGFVLKNWESFIRKTTHPTVEPLKWFFITH